MSDRMEAMDTTDSSASSDSSVISLNMLTKDLKDLAADWDEFAMYLNFETAEIDKIKKDVADVKFRTRHCFNGVMSAWFDGPKEKITVEVLAEAVEQCDRRVLAEEIREKDKTGNLKMTKPEISALLRPIQHKYATLAMCFEVPDGTVDHFEKFAGDSSRSLEKMLEIYVREKDPDVESLVQAVANVDKRVLSQSLKKKYQGKRFGKSINILTRRKRKNQL